MTDAVNDGGDDLVVAPTRDDAVVGALSERIGGPVGSRAGRHRWVTPLAMLLAFTAITFAVGMWQKTNCYNDDWGDEKQRFTHMCYSDLPYLYTGRGFAEGLWPYSHDPEVRARYPDVMEYPVGISYWAWATAKVTHLFTDPDLEARTIQPAGAIGASEGVVEETRVYVVVNAVGLGVLAMVSTWLLAGVSQRRPWDAAGFALAPTLALAALVNWDLLAVVFVAGALWAWARATDSSVSSHVVHAGESQTNRGPGAWWPAVTGVMIGLGTAAKLYPLFLLGGVLVICLRDKRIRDFAAVVVAAVLAWLAANAPAMLSGMAEWRHFWSFNDSRGADLGSIWLMLSQALDKSYGVDTINNVSLAFFAIWCAGVLALGLAAPRTPRLAQLGFLVVAGFLLINKVYSPQYVLWLLPLAVMARPRWRDLLVWQAGEVLYFAGVWWYLGGFLAAGRGDDAPTYWIATVVRLLAELYLVAVVARDILRPDHDPACEHPTPTPTRG